MFLFFLRRALGNQDIMDYSTSYSNGPDHYGNSMYNSPSMNGTRSPHPPSRQNGGYSPAVGTPTKNPNYQTYDYNPQQQGYQDGYHDDRYPPSVDGSDQYHGDQPYSDQPYRATSSPHGSDQYGGAAPRGGDRYDSYRDPQRGRCDSCSVKSIQVRSILNWKLNLRGNCTLKPKLIMFYELS